MLVLRRKLNEGFQIGKNIQVWVVELTPTKVAIGIEAPSDLKVLRHELIQYEEDDNDTNSD